MPPAVRRSAASCASSPHIFSPPSPSNSESVSLLAAFLAFVGFLPPRSDEAHELSFSRAATGCAFTRSSRGPCGISTVTTLSVFSVPRGSQSFFCFVEDLKKKFLHCSSSMDPGQVQHVWFRWCERSCSSRLSACLCASVGRGSLSPPSVASPIRCSARWRASSLLLYIVFIWCVVWFTLLPLI